ncbi:bifunctional demethylmenaquinone methyltransferase/2-methoxy-6-polyprenyl-1,4-benzoquinol methylase UbiE [uncultured Paludibaculum sp.]|uniref:bifunctional demethylmenaquinone methyltransferase/2-methoxy-6-polyprenyl-1,4-benzoquinol methylase UbiE n=1 Tax=uncultured Paludibaculum sp. TaxID=1765020 RepID=UPI002AAA71BA|nr:bifunctional demethylmenaquinone methyltransferase/2-methoxy-6-polyprenyl-1,4-benzoquinol methylase UbiE [uncultured Paludibaculum sp.]
MTAPRGTTPAGTASEEQAARYVRGMFGRVAGKYDLLNHLLSFQVDRYWRNTTVRRVEHILRRPGMRVMDLCCGTGDLLLAIEQRTSQQSLVLGSDFCHPMLVAALDKATRRHACAPLFEGDGLQLPLADNSLDLVTVAFGFRNFANYRKGLRELRRVLKPGGMLAILEFSTPPNALIRSVYGLYSRRILPAIGGLVSGSKDAYTYLPESVRKFPGAEVLAAEMEGAGYTRVKFERMTFGVVALHTGLSG